jgi:hypothetical protein
VSSLGNDEGHDAVNSNDRFMTALYASATPAKLA